MPKIQRQRSVPLDGCEDMFDVPVRGRKLRGRDARRQRHSAEVIQLPVPTPRTPAWKLVPKTAGQAALAEVIDRSDIVWALGPAGCGKTHIAVAKGVEALRGGRRLILSRPAVEAGEKLGFLPGGPEDKVAPYLRPIYDVLYQMMSPQEVEARIRAKQILIEPLAFLRGRTLADAFFVLDEAQNATRAQLVMAVTRLGQGSTMVLTGDPDQVDLDPRHSSGLASLAARVEGQNSRVGVVRLQECDVVRHPTVRAILPLLMP